MESNSITKWVMHAFFVCVVSLTLLLGMAKFMTLYEWFEWRRSGAEFMVSSGKVIDVYAYKGRRQGDRRLEILTESGNLYVHTSLSVKEVDRISNKSEEVIVKYYMMPFVDEFWVYQLGDEEDETRYFSGELPKKMWLVVVWMAILVVWLLVDFYLIYVYIRHSILKRS